MSAFPPKRDSTRFRATFSTVDVDVVVDGLYFTDDYDDVYVHVYVDANDHETTGQRSEA